MLISITVDELVQGLNLRLLNAKGDLSRTIDGGHVHYIGLALAGCMADMKARRVVMFGNSEARFLSELGPDEAEERLVRVFRRRLSCVVVSSHLRLPKLVRTVADRYRLPVLCSELPRHAIQQTLVKFLRYALAPRETVHGVMMDVNGMGVLLLGKSGIGKSECALELVKRGHRLISDDVVLVRKITDHRAIAVAAGRLKHYMELRGIGIIHIPSLFGIGAVTEEREIDLIIRFEEPRKGKEYERLGIEQETHDLLGVPVPLLTIPVVKGKNLSILVEVASMHEHLRQVGVNPAQSFTDELMRRLVSHTPAPSLGSLLTGLPRRKRD